MYLHACYRVGGMLPGKHYETVVLFVIYLVLKMFKNIDFYIKTGCTRGVRVFYSRARMQSSNSACMTKSSFISEKIV